MNEKPQPAASPPSQAMDPEHSFRFHCSPGVPCFTQCCRDVTVALTPYDVLRLKNRLAVDSGEFLDRHALILPKQDRLIPLVLLQMDEEHGRRCPFVSEQGCTVYEDRPWPCRMYPLDMNEDGTLRLIARPERCLGLNEATEWRIGDWLVDQGVVPYDEMNRLFTEITAPLAAQEPEIENPQIAKMVFMALYHLDRFRDFIFQSTFLDRLEVDPVRIEKIKRSDDELLKFAFDWIKFGIFGQILFRVRPEARGPEEPS